MPVSGRCQEDAASDADDDPDRGVYLPTDRHQERALDRARRLVADGRWSDAATLLDEVLAADRDFFIKRDAAAGEDRGTWTSVKTEAARLIRGLPEAGRSAYVLQFRARTDRLLHEAIAANDAAGIVAVARRWFATPAGQRAALVAAVEALESGQPLVAAAWLERLGDADQALAPTLAVMRSMALEAAGDPAAATTVLDSARTRSRGTARIAGRDVAISYPPGRGREWLRELGGPAGRPDAGGDWLQPRGAADRNAVVEASRPLLVPRYRVPLTRHPEESRRLDRLRRECLDQGLAAWPAAAPLAVAGTVLARAPLGLLAVDFATGKRIWLQSGPRSAAFEAAADGGQAGLARTFDDFTSGGVASDGRFAFVVETQASVLGGLVGDGGDPFAGGERQPPWQGGNTLSAYDIAAGGKLVWRLPEPRGGGRGLAAGAAESSTWFAGAPLVVGDRLYVLVEEHAELRLEVRAAADGAAVWSQPLAELDETHAIGGREAVFRRLAGAAPALADGVLVCPLGAGSVVAVDLANRTLSWAYDYARAAAEPADGGGINGRLRAFPGGLRGVARATGQSLPPRPGWCDDGPILAAGRALLTPRDSDDLHCLDLADGRVRWRVPREGRLQVAGVVVDRVIVVARDGVEALALDTGRRIWHRAFEAGVAPSGRGVLTTERLFLPLDTPEVVELAVADGAVAGRSPARGGAVPGNLVAYRGEVISLGVDAMDVFHQAAALEERIETAARDRPAAAWPTIWRAQLALDRGAVRPGIEQLRAALDNPDTPTPPDLLPAALSFALGRDFAAAVPLWRECLPATGLTPAVRAALAAVVDGSLREGDAGRAWEAWQELAGRSQTADAPETTLIADPRGWVIEPRWLRGRLQHLWQVADPPLRQAIDATLSGRLAAVAAAGDAGDRRRGLEGLAAVAGLMPVGLQAREELVAAASAMLAAAAEDGDALRALAVRRDLLLLDLARAGDERQRAAAREAIGRIGSGLDDTGGDSPTAAAWPLGGVSVRRFIAARGGPRDETRARLVPVALDEADEAFVPGLAAACEVQQSRLVFMDRFGRRLGDPVAVTDAGQLGMPMFDGAVLGAAALGRVVFVRAGAKITAVELGRRGNRRLWTWGDRGPADGTAALRFRSGTPAIPRNGGVPLGMRIVEPGPPATGATVWGRPVTCGLPVFQGATLTVLDPVTGSVVWERHGLPEASELINDEQVICVGTASGRRSPVLSMVDGRLLHEIDLPDRRGRLLSRGTRLLAIAADTAAAAADGGVAATVRLEVLDVADRSTVPVGEFSGAARACRATAGGLAVLDPQGELTLIDVAARRIAARSRLPAMPEAIDLLEVRPWEDRLLVCVGRRGPDTEDGSNPHAIAPLQQALLSGAASPPLDFSIWAVARDSGEVLWPVPATVHSHCLLGGQPVGLPVLAFARQIQRHHDREQASLSVLCLDTRTGHAVLEDDRIPSQPHMLFGCDLIGDPRRHTITVREHGGDPQRVTLEFSGGPAPPRPPHRAAGRGVREAGLFEGWDRWLERTLHPRRGS
jgi:outer membrane protein assembly factor BamB